MYPSSHFHLQLLPSEILHEILFRLPPPDLHRLRCVSRSLSSVVSSPDFRRLYQLHSSLSLSSWLFLLSRRPPRDSFLLGFHSPSSHWSFRLPLRSLPLPRFDDPYFLASSGPFFLFASNLRRDLVSFHLPSSTLLRLPPSPLGLRGTSSWRRSSLKLSADPDMHRFRFLFAEMYNFSPHLFEYRSDTNTWHASEAVNSFSFSSHPLNVYLHLPHTSTESLVLCTGPNTNSPLLLRPRFTENPVGPDRLHVYGDGNMVILKSAPAPIEEGSRVRVRLRILIGIELWGIGSDGSEWDLTSRVGGEMIEEVKKPYGVMMGCMAEREGVVRLVLMSNCNGAWDLLWLSYDRTRCAWSWVPVPDCGTKGLNMAGIALSSTFSRFK